MKNLTFEPMDTIKPKGWLFDQLQLQAEGLTGHLEEFWEDVCAQSGWLGGSGENWERGPYYLDGLVPLAYLLENEQLIAKSQKWIEWTLNSQDAQGNFGPDTNPDWWPRMVQLKVLIQYYQFTRDERVIDFMTRYFHYQHKTLPVNPLKNWAVPRSGDNIYSALWLYNITKESYLLELVEILHQQGTDWMRFFTDFPLTSSSKEHVPWQILDQLGDQRANDRDYQITHTVNVAMGLKEPALYSLLSKDERFRQASYLGIENLKRYHGLAHGVWSGDEHLSGKNPTQGSELCSVVEYLFSLEILLSVFGEVFFADQLEKVAYNALPATIAPDWHSHQYDQQVNQIECSIKSRGWYNNDETANLFGLEPHFGCCLANMHQGWPKFISSLWMKKREDVFAATVYGPNEMQTTLSDGSPLTIQEITDYPFDETIQFKIELTQPAEFELQLRIPTWAEHARLEKNGETLVGLKAGQFFSIHSLWKQDDVLVLTLPFETRTSFWFNRSVAIEHGPLLFALPIEEQWKILETRSMLNRNEQARQDGFWDFAVYPSSPWNYAVELTDENFSAVSIKKHPIAKQPFSPQTPALELWLPAKEVNAWKYEEGNTSTIPLSPVEIKDEPTQLIQLIPYGATNLRIAQFPWFIQNTQKKGS